MNPEQFRDAQTRLSLNRAKTARVFAVSERKVRRWSNGEENLPFAIAQLLRFVLDGKLSLGDVCHHDYSKTVTTGAITRCEDCGKSWSISSDGLRPEGD